MKQTMLLLLCLQSMFVSVAHASDQLNQPVISIIIDDLGYRLKHGERAVQLPARLTYAFLPKSPHAVKLAEAAHQLDQEIMVHMPMESDNAKRLGPGGLTQCMTEEELANTVKADLAAIPYARGFNNHMGSLMTRSDVLMETVMKAAARPGLYFVDSRTTSDSVAEKHAQNNGLHSVSRDIFLDHEQTAEFIHAQLDKLIKRAKRKGSAIAIGHPYRVTLEVLEQWLPKARQQGVRFVTVSELINWREQKRLALWQKQQ